MKSFGFISFSSPLPLLTTIRCRAWFTDPILYLEVKRHALHMKLSHGWWVMAGFSTLKARTYPLSLTAHLVTFYKTFTLLNFTTRDDFLMAVAFIPCGRVLPMLLSIASALCRRLVVGTSASSGLQTYWTEGIAANLIIDIDTRVFKFQLPFL